MVDCNSIDSENNLKRKKSFLQVKMNITSSNLHFFIIFTITKPSLLKMCTTDVKTLHPMKTKQFFSIHCFKTYFQKYIFIYTN